MKITIDVLVRKPVEEIWEYFTEPVHIRNWNFASDDWHCPFAESELKVGGKFRYTMASKHGKHSFDFSGKFIDIGFWKFIKYELNDGRLVEIKFDECHEGTIIKEIFDAETIYPIDLQKAGWQAILNNFKIYAESR